MNNLGLYIHIPFCLQKCAYCDFYSLSGCLDRAEEYIDKVCEQMETLSALCRAKTVDTIYVGGGTPSILAPRFIEKLIYRAAALFCVSETCEITLEANPATDVPRRAPAWLACGVNRVSFGVQSYRDETLRRIGRLHSFREACESVEAARRSGIENISCDLMYALPGQQDDEIARATHALLPLGVKHLSLYGLKIEKNTPFGRDPNLILPDEDAQCQTYLDAVALFERLGLQQYEISNFAFPGYESRHNLRYWQREEYLGFGPGAHSFFDGIRFAFARDLYSYLKTVDFSLNSGAYAEMTRISPAEAIDEEIMLSLRLTRGFEREKLLIHANDKEKMRVYLSSLEKAGYARREGTAWALTPRGMLVSNSIISDILLNISK